MTALEAVDCGPVPTALVAETLKVYVLVKLSPDTVTDVPGGDPVTVVAVWAVVPMNGVTVYLVRVLPPLFGAVQETAADELWAVATTLVGAAGGPAGVTALEGAEAGPAP